jgi:phosphoribosylformylglycinamidine synthase subunit PurSL
LFVRDPEPLLNLHSRVPSDTTSTHSPAAPSLSPSQVHRIEVRTQAGHDDPRAAAVLRHAREMGLAPSAAASARVYLIEAALLSSDLVKVAARLLADPVIESSTVGAAPASGQIVEVHPLPGVMDPAAQSVREAIRALVGIDATITTGVRYDISGVTPEQAATLARTKLANPVVHQLTSGPFHPAALPHGEPTPFTLRTVSIRDLSEEALVRFSREAHLFMSRDELLALQAHYRDLGREPTDIELETIAQTWSEHCVHKTLKSTIHYRNEAPPPQAAAPAATGPAPAAHPTPRPPQVRVDFAFTPTGRAADAPPSRERPADAGNAEAPDTSSHDAINWNDRPNHELHTDGSVTIKNLLKATVAAATFELIDEGVDWALSVFKDNSGVVELDDDYAVCIKVETHNRPSAIEPYGGAATGIGGCIRDVIGTGLGAKPIASTDVFCVAHPDRWADAAATNSDATRPLPPGTLHPRRILSEVVAGVRDYGNRMGIPTVAGGVHFDDRYIGNPMVYCGCVGLLPRHLIHGKVQAGDRIIALGGRTGRDGIHGATFSSAEMESTHKDEFAHAVQIGNAIEEKRVLDAILRARDYVHPIGGQPRPLYNAMTDCGAGGFSSAVGEMGKDLGAQVDLEKAPLKYAGLTYTEIWISEAQERMVLAVPAQNLAALDAICTEEGVEWADLGVFGTPNADLVLRYHNTEVGRLSMHFLHEGLPMPTREAVWRGVTGKQASRQAGKQGEAESNKSVGELLSALLSHPSIASKHWIIRQYDHEVQGNTVVKPLVGPGGRGPSDASVIEPRPGTGRGIALSQGLATSIGDPALGGDPYFMALAAIDECVRNLVCVGANPNRIAILDNFCWPSCEKPENLGALVRAAEGCYDGAKAYRTPFVSGKDSLNNQLRYTDPATGEARVVEIPPTLLITGMGQVTNISRCVTMDAKKEGNLLVLIGTTGRELGGSYLQQISPGHACFRHDPNAREMPRVDLAAGPLAARAIAQAIADGLITSAHDCSDGGMLAAVAEMLIATTGNAPDAAPASGGSTSLLADLLSGKGTTLPPLGAELTIDPDVLDLEQLAFAETPSRYVIEIVPDKLAALKTVLRDHDGVPFAILGKVTRTGRLTWAQADLDASVEDLTRAWRGPLDW